MDQETTRRQFLRGGTLATAGLLAAQVAQGQDTTGKQEDHGDKEYPRDHPGPGGPVGSSTDRGKLVPGSRNPTDPPVPIVTPDIPKLKWEMKDGFKEFQLHCMNTRREFLPGAWMDVWGYNDSMPGPTI